jgi:glucokinase
MTETRAERGSVAVLQDALAMVQHMLADSRKQKYKPTALGISVCELVDRDGNIVSDYTLDWRDQQALEPFRSFLPVTVEADSHAAALAEAKFGAGKELTSFLYVTIGTGISCSLVLDGAPYQGASGCTGTMATGTLASLCSECGEISLSCLERMASGLGIELRYMELSGKQATTKVILIAAEQGDLSALKVIKQAGACVGSTIGLLVSVLDPHAVIVGGGLGSSRGLYWDSLVRTARDHIWSDRHRDLPIVQGSLGADAGAIGAAVKARQLLRPH